MCGIAGIFSPNGFDFNKLMEMSRIIRHRGPDGEGFVGFNEAGGIPVAGSETPENCVNRELPWSPKNRESLNGFNGGFAHRRLAIIDLEETGYQPMCTADGRYWITYNGEIYNYLELKDELGVLGCQFITQSDTEVILAAFITWGKACLQRFNGMWAFAIFDTKTNQLFAARDRFGVKPFYYFNNGKQFLFASEQKAIVESGFYNPSINPEAVFDYFVFSQIEFQDESFFKGIIELQPSYYLELDVNSMKLNCSRYYQLPVLNETGSWNEKKFDEAVPEIRQLLTNAVRLRLRADVEVGSCLSGGMDSSAIVGLMRNQLPTGSPFHVFTAAFPGSFADESQWADMMAAHAGAIDHKVTPDVEGLIKDLAELTRCQDVPIWSTSTYAQFSVMKLVKEKGIKVVLDGQGGDEVFGGYAPHFSFLWNDLNKNDKRNEYAAFGGNSLSARFHLKQQIRFKHIFNLPAAISSRIYRQYFPDISFLNQDFYQAFKHRFILQREYIRDTLNERLAFEMQNTSLKGYLKTEDRCSMWSGIESRTPFADDHLLIEAAFSLPAALKIRDGKGKALLREAARPFIPNAIADRTDKMGYATPNNQWIKQIAPEVRHLFNDDLKPFIDLKKLDKSYSTFFDPKGNADTGRIFKFISFASWMNVFFGK